MVECNSIKSIENNPVEFIEHKSIDKSNLNN